MNATTPPSFLDVQEQISRIIRGQEETRKFSAEQHKLTAEAVKLSVESAKLNRDRRLAPLLLVTSMGGLVASATGGAIAVSVAAWLKLHFHLA